MRTEARREREGGSWIRRTTIGCGGMLALIAGTVSYLHMHLLVELHGQPGWVAALIPLSVDGMIVAASTTLLVDSRGGWRGGLPWILLVIGSFASLAANVAVAEPTMTGRMIAAWPSFSLIAAYELPGSQCREAGRTSRLGPGRGTAVDDMRLDAWRWAQGQPSRGRLATLGPGHRRTVWPSRAAVSALQAIRPGREVS